jgi:hypothetical protein
LESHTNRPQRIHGMRGARGHCGERFHVDVNECAGTGRKPASHPPPSDAHPTNARGTHSLQKRQRTTKKLQEKKARATTCLSHQWGCAQGGGRAAVKSAVFGVLTGRVSASRRSSPPRPKKILRCVPVAQKSSSFVASRSHGQIVTCYVTVEDIYIRTDPDSREGKSSRALCSWRGFELFVWLESHPHL